MKKPYLVYFVLCLCLLSGFAALLGGCGGEEEKSGPADTGVTEFTVQKLLEFCDHPESAELYCSVQGENAIYHYDAGGNYVESFPVTADDDRELRAIAPGVEGYEQALTGLCIDGDTLYCYRVAKQTLLSLNLATGESRVCMDTESITIHKAEALGNTLLIYGILNARLGEQLESTSRLMLLDLSTGEGGELSVGGQPMGITKDREGGVYWLAVYEEGTGYFLQKYDPEKKSLSERYETGLQDIITDIAYSPEEKADYGYVMNTMEYVKIVPEDAQAISVIMSWSPVSYRSDRLFFSGSYFCKN